MSGIQAQDNHALTIADSSSIQNELGIVDSGAIKLATDVPPEIENQAEEFIKAILAYDPNDSNMINARDWQIIILLEKQNIPGLNF